MGLVGFSVCFLLWEEDTQTEDTVSRYRYVTGAVFFHCTLRQVLQRWLQQQVS